MEDSNFNLDDLEDYDGGNDESNYNQQNNGE
jgi:hypothetical protein